MFDKILIANRGEIGVRIIKTCRRMGIKTAIVFSEADRGSMAVEMADEAVFIGPPPAAQSYLDQDKIVAAVRQTGAQAVHPGFGFLSEKVEFAERLAAENITFIGPNPRAIFAMGDKIESKKTAAAAGVSCVPGHIGEIADTAHAIAISEEIGYPVMIKASAGGGGKGIRVAYNRKDVEEGFPAVKAEAMASFGDDRIFIEKFILAPRHIEIQVLGDKHGNVVHLFERECSIQRRNQKVVEEAPSPLLDPATRALMGEQAVALARAVGYDSAGTVEFVASGADKSFYFLEMNTRLQVEHPVTEMITGLDLVEQMLRVAAGETLAFGQDDLAINGWAVESRIYAEDPYRGFLPSIGRLRRYLPPVEGTFGDVKVRNDAGVREGDEISMFYDPMISKLVTWAPDRLSAIDAQSAALDSFAIEGIQDNTPFLSAVMNEPVFRSGTFTTAYIKDTWPDGFAGAEATEAVQRLMAGVAALIHTRKSAREALISGRLAPSAEVRRDWTVLIDRAAHPLRITPTADGAMVVFESGRSITIVSDFKPGDRVVTGTAEGSGGFEAQPFAVKFKDRREGFDLLYRGVRASVIVCTPRAAELHGKLPEKVAADRSGEVISPMPGLVVSLEVAVGSSVKSGEAVAIVEAMKMQNIIRAERDGKVTAIHVKAGDPVAADEVMVELA
ncbi:MAG: acetyl/propionyl/methylcrotonyl-CoA carboxylase subunit alpha [Hyphomonadaceae bacterium]|jgi:propionyl-CoA carboxylase alpha chain|nr:acetyl/propionyl/methylcrotonyl-CoA carboxylase subunit alpha [Hyphomonadaceae bacterium]